MKVSHRITPPGPDRPRGPRSPPAPAANAVPASPDRQPAERVVIDPPVVQSIDNGCSTGPRPRSAPAIAGGMILLVVWGGVAYRQRHEPTRLVR